MLVLQTLRLTLHPCSPADRDDFIALERDPDVMRHLNGGRVVDVEHPDLDATYLMPRGTEEHVWTARRVGDLAFVGWFCLWPDSETQAELGFRLCRAAWGEGLATEAGTALVGWGFATAGYDRIVSCTMTVNAGARRVMEKLGMRHARTVPFDADTFPGTEQGEVWYEVTRSAWRGGEGRLMPS